MLGAIITGFYLIPLLGISTILDITAGMLILISLFWFAINKMKRKISIFLILMLVLGLAVKPRADGLGYKTRNVKVVYEKHSVYSKLKVLEYRGKYRYMVSNGAVQNWFEIATGVYSYKYFRMMEKVLKYHGNVKNVLMIGLGTGGMDAILKNQGIKIESVELDVEIVKIARKYFNFNGEVIIGEGRNYLRNSGNKYDLVIVDAFNGYTIYPYIVSKEAFDEIKVVLKPGGFLVINTVTYNPEAGDGEHDKLIYSINKTLKAAFGNVYMKADSYGLANLIFYASDKQFETDEEFVDVKLHDKGIILTDNYNPADYFTTDVMEKWRKKQLNNLAEDFML